MNPIITNHKTTITERRHARTTHSGRDGLTVAHVRAFLAAVDIEDIPENTRVTVEDKLAGEGANRSGYIEASVQAEIEVPK